MPNIRTINQFKSHVPKVSRRNSPYPAAASACSFVSLNPFILGANSLSSHIRKAITCHHKNSRVDNNRIRILFIFFDSTHGKHADVRLALGLLEQLAELRRERLGVSVQAGEKLNDLILNSKRLLNLRLAFQHFVGSCRVTVSLLLCTLLPLGLFLAREVLEELAHDMSPDTNIARDVRIIRSVLLHRLVHHLWVGLGPEILGEYLYLPLVLVRIEVSVWVVSVLVIVKRINFLCVDKG